MQSFDWEPDQMPDQHGRTVVVTGATGGLGLAVATRLAAAGARVVAGVRDLDKAARVLPSGLEARLVDTASVASVTAFARHLAEDGIVVDALVNNAGGLRARLRARRRRGRADLGHERRGTGGARRRDVARARRSVAARGPGRLELLAADLPRAGPRCRGGCGRLPPAPGVRRLEDRGGRPRGGPRGAAAGIGLPRSGR
ncbi:SDR family NAD(P)-dependent oxidoreductase [Curtobacterium sp. MCPF17_052]|uniref:SDR family NAD(P)-dependent oxidoreductase n=1 Tax=Curtobacterium sp. MCPF17_052 TaxID=2175655 RepID=UPI0024DFFD4A|nr:SDR family NAD(P)-dependent oxidoreductase [Curtobacterium sp. MCPF17_052]WIB13616.1 SDR family NAD(P)-dependent oxidoreductase [Curtobacterium sp. MCPF17_052]